MLTLCCVSSVPRWEGRGGWKKRNTQPQVEMISQKTSIHIFYNWFLYLSLPQCSLSDFINASFFFCLIQGLIIVISFIFSWGAEFLTRLIFGSKAASGFNLRGLYYQKRMFQNVCLLLTTPSRARMQSVFCCLNERLLAHVFNKEQSESGERREERGEREKKKKLTTGSQKERRRQIK